jgi:PIN domain nuclease of toxin-antitoxin system
VDKGRIVHLDTNVLIWLFEGRVERLTKAARRAIGKSEPVASAATVFELEMLHQATRRQNSAEKLISALGRDIGLQICNLSFRAVVEPPLSEAWTHDPFDRLIVANAKAAGVPLVTADEKIRQHYSRAIW